ncbi:AbrB/MazE/SpoVT family DNA-binding domain-containing protein [Deinococcus psychrotolerans]|uniref:AbrB/MazE/SpoVT family DNA-binding domain-containing protein n=1 Tax=Deinococcus psychrotolerans TaxID=2489213 RepID=A0A3G8YAM4_9DEIO|nr:AbrB/MazE/SpoVT family DNA-binding domain-containing protein [Deinococcus psychrotolerans]AZI42402.1 AbrB/MazE/SpoVT family DNA-binding domain-containing protein [Deinococcus psychrotolerans]
MKSTVTSKGQTTIPKFIREQLRLRIGSEIDWQLEGGTLTVRLAEPSNLTNPYHRFLGAFRLPEGQTTADVLCELRGEPEIYAQQGEGAKIMTLEDVLAEQA